ncbi:MAG TPA: DUF4421 family protein [Spirochaetota bacterium]|nr:DUF4421 family protein [Spirochaetota bacterium]HQA52975.1 DUF4421 family protein [Spirochaetota bacterium]
MRTIVLSILLLLAPFSPIFSEEDSASDVEKANDSPKDFAIRFNADVPLMIVDIKSESKDMTYDSNAKWLFGISASYKNFGFSISKSGGNNDETEKYGKTKARDYQLYMFKKHIGVEVFFQKMKGFYIWNPDDYDYSAGDPETIRSDIKTRHIGTNVYYSFSDNFSLANVYDYQNPIEKCGGSFLLYLGFDITNISSDSGFIPEKARDDFDFAAEVKTVNAVNFYAGIGYTYAVVFYDFFAAASVIFAGGPSFSQYDMSGSRPDHKKVYPVIHYNMKYTLGYNSNSFTAGFYAFWHSSEYGIKKCKIQIDSGKAGFFAGTRF